SGRDPDDGPRIPSAPRLVHKGSARRLRLAPAALCYRVDGGSRNDLCGLPRGVRRDDGRVKFERLPFATIDHLRPITQGHQEVIFCPGKTIAQVVAIAERLETAVGAGGAGGSFLATRADTEQSNALAERFPRAEVNTLGRTVFLPPDPEPPPTGRGTVLICTAGTSDLPVAEEAAVTARALKNRVERLTEVGVAGT